MDRRIVNWLVLVFHFTVASFAQAQHAGKLYRVGYVSTVGSPDANFEELRQGLRDLGYVEGRNITFEYRAAEGKAELIPGFVAELVQTKVDLLFCPNLPAIHAAKKATNTIPIVMATSGDPVGTGLVASLARPGGNVTGLSILATDLDRKWLELLKEAAPIYPVLLGSQTPRSFLR